MLREASMTVTRTTPLVTTSIELWSTKRLMQERYKNGKCQSAPKVSGYAVPVRRRMRPPPKGALPRGGSKKDGLMPPFANPVPMLNRLYATTPASLRSGLAPGPNVPAQSRRRRHIWRDPVPMRFSPGGMMRRRRLRHPERRARRRALSCCPAPCRGIRSACRGPTAPESAGIR